MFQQRQESTDLVLMSADPVAGEPAGTDAGARDSGTGQVGLRVLIVDDEDDARELLAEVLSLSGFSVQAAGSAAEAFALFAEFRPDVLVSDIGMPHEDGYSLMRRIRALGIEGGGDIPAIALTAYTRDKDRQSALDAGFSRHMGKPVSIDDLVAALEAMRPAARPVEDCG